MPIPVVSLYKTVSDSTSILQIRKFALVHSFVVCLLLLPCLCWWCILQVELLAVHLYYLRFCVDT